MNYLSHLYLSLGTPESMTGNLMGDFKPDQELRTRLPQAVKLGIENHRLVDRLTDRFQPVKELRLVFSKERRRYAGIITDIAFDYFLIKHWDVNTDGDFVKFTQNCYHGLAQCEHWMPARMAYVVGKMTEHKWLSSYGDLEGIGQSIDQVSKRLRFPNNMAGGVVEVHENYAEIEQVFLDLFQYLKLEIASAAIERQSVG